MSLLSQWGQLCSFMNFYLLVIRQTLSCSLVSRMLANNGRNQQLQYKKKLFSSDGPLYKGIFSRESVVAWKKKVVMKCHSLVSVMLSHCKRIHWVCRGFFLGFTVTSKDLKDLCFFFGMSEERHWRISLRSKCGDQTHYIHRRRNTVHIDLNHALSHKPAGRESRWGCHHC